MDWMVQYWPAVGAAAGAGLWSLAVFYELRSIRRNLRLVLRFFRAHRHTADGSIALDPSAATFPDSDGQIRPPGLR